jgi:RHS repeat-associated protein
MPMVLRQDHKRDGTLSETAHYLYGLGLISGELARLEPPSQFDTFFYHTDGLESTVALTNGLGRVRAQYQYDAWGNLENSRGKVPNRFLFTGEEQDPQSGLYYLRARWYDPTVGGFLTKDPFGGIAAVPQSFHAYIYAFTIP